MSTDHEVTRELCAWATAVFELPFVLKYLYVIKFHSAFRNFFSCAFEH